MRSFYKLALACIVLILGISTAQAQITITSNEFPAIGQSFIYYDVVSNGSGIPFSPGPAGGGQTWTFDPAQFPGGETYQQNVVDAAATPFAASFPGSNIALQQVNGDTSIYGYGTLSTGGFNLNGFALDAPDTTFVNPYEDAEETLVFPLTMNTSWTLSSVDTIDAAPGFYIVIQRSANNVVDAWGTVVLPGGSYPALRIRSDATTVTTTYFNGVPIFSETLTSINYSWAGENVGLLAFANSMDGETNPNFTLASSVTFQTTTVGVAQDDHPQLTSFELYPAYPNPFNPETTIRFQVPKTAQVDVTVYSILGQPVKQLAAGQYAPGVYSVKWDGTNSVGASVSSGVYLISMRAGDFHKVQKVILNR
jgi:hypothetical protein